ncbi:MAG: Crp/Fnr family transcriptional regulator [Candidatus Firestonebacteria bacterium]
MNRKEFLKTVPLFDNVSLKDLGNICKNIIERRYPKGSFLFFENEEGNSLYIMVSGLVKIFTSDQSGRIKTLAYLKEGDFFGEMAMLDEQKRSASASVMEESIVLILNRSDFQREILNKPFIAIRLMQALSFRLRSADKQIEDLTFRNLPGRVASALIELTKKYGEKTPEGVRISLRLTHQELAEIIGTAREVVTSILNDFRKANCITINQKHITITNFQELKSWIN